MKNGRNIKSALWWYLWLGAFVVLLFYTFVQYMIFKNAYEQNFFNEASYTERLLQTILENYKITLEKISDQIKEKELFSDKVGIADSLEKAHVYGIENEHKEKIRTSGINWVGVGGAPVGRLGEVQYTLEFPPEYLNQLEKKCGILESSKVIHIEGFSDLSFINFGIGIRDDEGKYRGFVNARLNLNSLREALTQHQRSSFRFILLDGRGYEVISSYPVDQSLKEDLDLQLPVNGFPYVLRFGYDQNQFYILFFKQTYWSFLLVCSCLCFFAFFTYDYHQKFIKKALRFHKENNREKDLKLDQLTQENHRLTEREKTLEKYIKSSEEADKEEKSFYLEINKRISQSLSKMLNIANYLLSRLQEESKIEEDSKELMEVFEHTYTHSRFFTLKKEEEFVSINDVLGEALVILSKQILKKDLYITFSKEKPIAILTDRTTLKQAVINILGRSIKNSPKKGEISLKLFSHEETVCLECRDNGYLGESVHKEQGTSGENVLSLDCISLEREDMEKLVKSLGGTLSALYEPYKGNTSILRLPYQVRNVRDTTEEEGNDISNIISFSDLRKKKGY